MFRPLLLLLLGFLTLSTASQANESRVALVIGNSAYKRSPLENPVNDAKDMAAKLRKLGFEVIEHKNIKTSQISSILDEFGRKLQPGGVALVFYAGHGLQIKNENYFPAVDAEIRTKQDVPYQSVSLKQIMDVLDDSKTKLNLVFLDACRDNPFAQGVRSLQRGLAEITPATGTLISYATRPGSIADDGDGRNGLYTSKLLIQLDSTEPVELSLKWVVREVKKASQGEQEPWMEGNIEGDFCFAGCRKADAELEKTFWDSIKDSGKREYFDAYLQQYPKGSFAALATLKIKDLTASLVTTKPTAAPKVKQPTPTPSELAIPTTTPTSTLPLAQLEAAPKPKVTLPKSKPLIAPLSTPEPTPPATAVPKLAASSVGQCAWCPEMVDIPAGSFMMGSPEDELGRYGDEPLHSVTVRAFALGKYEVTQAQWQKVMGNNPSSFKECGDNCPVEQVSWDDVQVFIEKLNQQAGQRYRLPTEAEWEYAARGGTQGARYWGGGANACAYANVGIDIIHMYGCSDGYQYTVPVGRFRANAFGLYDMLGNVWEWTCSVYTENGYNGSEKICNNDVGSRRVFRGGSWTDILATVRSAYRSRGVPSSHSSYLGFRLAQDR